MALSLAGKNAHFSFGLAQIFFYGKTKVVDLAEISIMVPSNYSLGEVSAHNYSYQKSPIFAGERMVHARYCVQDPTFIFAFVFTFALSFLL